MKLFLEAWWANFHTKVIGRKLVRDVGVLTIANFVGAGLSFAQGILIARWLGPELYGVAALVMTYPGLIFTFFDARSSEASVKYLSEFHAQGDRDRVLAMCKLGYLIDLGIACLAFLTVLFTASWASEAIAHRPETVGLIVIYAAAFIPRGLVGTSRAVMVTLGKFPLIAWIETGTTFLRVMLVLGLAMAGWQVAGVVWGNTIAMTVMGLVKGAIGWLMIYRHWGALPFQGKLQNFKQERMEIFKFLFYNNLTALLGIIPKQLDVILLGYFRSSLEVGYYQIAKNLSSIVSYFVGPLQSVTYPEFSRLIALEDKKYIHRKAKRIATKVGIPLGLVAIACGLSFPFVLPILLGDNYHQAIAATQILFLGYATWLSLFWLRPFYLTLNKVKQWSIGIAVYSIIFGAVSIPITIYYGYIGICYWQSLALFCFHVFMIVNVIRDKGVSTV